MAKFERLVYFLVIMAITAFGILTTLKNKKNVAEIKTHTEGEIQLINYHRILEQISEDSKINTSLALINDKNATLSLTKFSEDGCLFMYYNVHGCDVCVDNLLNHVYDVFGNKADNFSVITNSEGYRDLLVQFANSHFDYNQYYIWDKLNIPLCDEGISFFFWVDEDCRAEHIFIPDKKYPVLTESYLALAINRFLL